MSLTYQCNILPRRNPSANLYEEKYTLKETPSRQEGYTWLLVINPFSAVAVRILAPNKKVSIDR